jgi:SSS family solute:Na+ symporter
VIAVYVSMGGLTAVLYSDTIQCIVMVAGIGIVLPITLLIQVPSGALLTAAPPEFYSLMPTDMAILTTSLAWGTSALANQTIWARIVAAKDVKTAYKANIIGSGVGIIWGFIMALIAFSMIAVYPDIDGGADTFLVRVITDSFPVVITGLILAAVLANVVTTADSVILAGVMNLSHDLYRKTFKRNATDAQVLKFSRISTPFVIVIPVILGVIMPLIIEVQNIGYAVYGAGVAVPFWFALLSKKPLSRKAGIASILVGFGVSGYFYLNPVNFPNSVIGMACCLITFLLVNFFDKNKGSMIDQQQEVS